MGSLRHHHMGLFLLALTFEELWPPRCPIHVLRVVVQVMVCGLLKYIDHAYALANTSGASVIMDVQTKVGKSKHP